MAKAKKSAPAASTNKTKVTRITASDTKSKRSPQPKKSATKVTTKTAAAETAAKPTKKAESTDAAQSTKKAKKDRTPRVGIFARFRNYVIGSWHELQKVRWPSRAATWRMTGALILFVLIFTGFIVLLDTFFNFIFTKALGA